VNILFFVAGLPFGALGVAVAYSVSSYILIGPALWYAGKPIQLKLSSVLSSIWKYYVSALIAGLLCWFILHKVDLTSNIFKEFNILLRIITSVSLCISIYVFLVVALHQSIKPISQFISVVNEMVPKISGRNVLKVRD
jgi:PST family polysaccharide transporter